MGSNFARFLLVFGVLAAGQSLGQQNPAQQDPPQPPQQANPKPLKSNQLDPNGKVSDIPDPTKDPTKDPSTDITKDPTKDPDAVSAANIGTDENKVGADAAGVTADAPDYTGPAILSRGFALTRPNVPVNEPLRFYAGVNATYDSGLIGAYVQNQQIPAVSSEGADFNWGATMRRYRRKSIFDLNYSGHYYDYYSSSKYSGQDHALAAGYTYQFSPRFTVGLRETAGLYSNTYSVLNSTAIADVSTASSTIVVAPNTEAFNDRTYYSTTTGSVSYQYSARLSFSINGTYFLVNRNSIYLADTRGYQTGGDIAYRITRRQTVGIYYSHSEFSYTKIFGDTNADSIGFNYGTSLDRFTDLSVRFGGTRFESQSLGEVIPNPLVQQVLGIQAGIEKFDFVGYSPDFTVTLNRKLRNSSVGASFVEGITPGNGLVLTSKRQGESVFWNLPTFRRYAAQLGGGRDVLSGYTNGMGTSGSYTSYYARLSLSHPVTRLISSVLNFDYRQYGFGGTSFHQNEYRISIGFRWSPGDGPIKLW